MLSTAPSCRANDLAERLKLFYISEIPPNAGGCDGDPVRQPVTASGSRSRWSHHPGRPVVSEEMVSQGVFGLGGSQSPLGRVTKDLGSRRSADCLAC